MQSSATLAPSLQPVIAPNVSSNTEKRKNINVATISQFRAALLSTQFEAGNVNTLLNNGFRISQENDFSVYYAPFEHIEPKARIVIVGITPGLQQAMNALREAQRALLASQSDADAARAAKVFASFSGPMRSNLVSMLDYIGVHRILSIDSTADLWTHHSNLVHFTSALRYPVFVGGKNYSGTPSMLKVPMLVQMIDVFLAEETRALPDAIWVPLGPAATDGVNRLIQSNLLHRDQVLHGLPHPSGANAERIAYFLQRKARSDLSAKTSPEKIDLVRDRLIRQVASIGKPARS